MLCCFILLFVVMYSVVLYCIVLYCIVLYGVALYCVLLYCDVLYCASKLKLNLFNEFYLPAFFLPQKHRQFPLYFIFRMIQTLINIF